MMRSMFAAISGLRVHQTMLDVTANNIANVNTAGYKSERTSFKDMLSQLQRDGGAPTAAIGGTNPAQIGLGVQLGSIDNVMNAGAIQSTGSPTDIAIQGEGWFQVSNDPANAASTTYYTRSGNFARDAQGNLVTPDGYYVVGLDAGGAKTKIAIPADAKSFAIDSAGNVNVVPATGAAVNYKIQLAKFPNEAGLQRAAANRWTPSNNAGAPVVADAASAGYGSLATGSLEMSNVDLAQEFTGMITAQRGFQANGRVISAADQMLQELVNLNR
jgi:flagellar hook protein FlgE